MLIEIDKSIIEYINSVKDTKDYKNLIDVIQELAIAYKRNNHIIIASSKVLEYLKDLNDLNEDSRQIYNYLYNDAFEEYKELKKMFIFYIKLVFDKQYIFKEEKEGNQTIFNISIGFIKTFKEFRESVLITEDLDDGKLYISMTKEYIKEYIGKDKGISIEFDDISGGGANTHKSYKNFLEKNRLTLCVLDSDKTCKKDEKGSTAKKVEKVRDEYEDKVTYVCILDVREKENLIPPSFYKLCSNGINSELIDKLIKLEDTCYGSINFLRYGDIKDGITLKKYIETKSRKKCIFKCYSDLICDNIKRDFPNIDELEECEKNYETKEVVLGVGGNASQYFKKQVLDKEIVQVLNQKKRVYEINANEGLEKDIKDLERNINISENLFKHLPNYIKDDWIEICNTILAWGCKKKGIAIG